jgi:hypothetical protein
MTPGLLFEQTYTPTRRCFMLTIKALAIWVSTKKFFFYLQTRKISALWGDANFDPRVFI